MNWRSKQKSQEKVRTPIILSGKKWCVLTYIFREILEFIGIADEHTVPLCFNAPGLSESIELANSG
jgi:hypothetical protein